MFVDDRVIGTPFTTDHPTVIVDDGTGNVILRSSCVGGLPEFCP